MELLCKFYTDSVMAIIILVIVVAILLVTTAVFAVLWCTGTPPPKWSKIQANHVVASDVKQGTEVCVYFFFISATEEVQRVIN